MNMLVLFLKPPSCLLRDEPSVKSTDVSGVGGSPVRRGARGLLGGFAADHRPAPSVRRPGCTLSPRTCVAVTGSLPLLGGSGLLGGCRPSLSGLRAAVLRSPQPCPWAGRAGRTGL